MNQSLAKLNDQFRQTLTSEIKKAAKAISLSRGIQKEQFKEARKSLKRVRSVLRLLRDSISEDQFKSEERHIKDLSKAFRPVRNACVTEEVLTKLLVAHKTLIAPADAKEILAVLGAHTQNILLAAFNEDKTLRSTLGDLQAALERIPRLEIKGSLKESAIQGIKRSYRANWEDFESCHESNFPEIWVSWRKNINFLATEVDLVKGHLTGEIRDWNEKVHQLSDCLGEHQDLLFLEEEAAEIKSLFENRKLFKSLIELSIERRKELRKQVRKEAKHLFLASPKEFIQTLSSTW